MGGQAVVRAATTGDWIDRVQLKAAVGMEPAIWLSKDTIAADIKIPVFFASGTADPLVPSKGV